MTPLEEFKIFLIRHDLSLSPALDIVRYNPELLKKYSMEEIAILATYLTTELRPASKQVKIKPIIYNCCQLAAMKEKMTLVDWLDKTLFEATQEIVNPEIEYILDKFHKKISNK